MVTIVATLFATRKEPDRAQPDLSMPGHSSAAGSNFRSDDDRAAAAIVLEDPTCESWEHIANSFGQAANNGWDRRDPATPATAWTPDARNQYEAFGAATESAADRSNELAKQTPHRVMRELYQQFAAYGRAYADSLSSYEQKDDHLIRVAISGSSALTAICRALTYGSAGARSPLIADAAPSMTPPAATQSESPQLFLQSNIPACSEWMPVVNQFEVDSSAWRSVDPNIAASQMNLTQRSILTAIAPVMNAFATNIQLIGRHSGDPLFIDFATLSAQYLRAYAASLVTYVPADDYLQVAAGTIGGIITEA
ncbi:hypothetical protein [Mycolicibacterium obuense]|uniref:hypothetical protein n=1 Tax=Mycolicibacterium obuense TaxID=1807 RepID=UPI001039B0D0|nr:hypothetical protein [Mycolicibacterium obuense]